MGEEDMTLVLGDPPPSEDIAQSFRHSAGSGENEVFPGPEILIDPGCRLHQPGVDAGLLRHRFIHSGKTRGIERDVQGRIEIDTNLAVGDELDLIARPGPKPASGDRRIAQCRRETNPPG